MRVERALLEELPEKKFNIGYQGEQNHTQVIISCPIMFRDYPDAVASMVVKPPQGDLYPVSLTRDGNDLTWDVSDADVAIPGEGILQLTFTDGEGEEAEIIKTVYGSYSVNSSLVADGEAPDPVQSWLDEAGAALATFENEIGDIRKITTATDADEGLALSPKTVVNGKVTEWEYIDLADPDVVTQAVDDWLDDHPEATTTVQDGAITEAKLNDSLKEDLAWQDDVDELKSAITRPEFIVGNAEEVLSDRGETDEAVYLFRETGGTKKAYNREKVQKLVGGTVAWNQLIDNTNSASVANNSGTKSYDSTTRTWTITQTTVVSAIGIYATRCIPGHKYFVSAFVKPSVSKNIVFGIEGSTSSVSNVPTSGSVISTISTSNDIHAFVFYFTLAGATDFYADFRDIIIVDLTAALGSTIADYLYTLETQTAGSGVALFRSLFDKSYYAYNSGSLESVNVSEHRLTGKNLLKTPYSDSSGSAAGITATVNNDGTVKFNGTVRSDYYFRFRSNNDKMPISAGTYTISINEMPQYCALYIAGTYLNKDNKTRQVVVSEDTEWTAYIYIPSTSGNINFTLKIQVEFGSTATEYEPYQQFVYSMPNVTLRGIPKLVNNEIVFDGDELLPDGTVTRRYGVVDLGTLNWTKTNYFVASLSYGKKTSGSTVLPNIMCAKYAKDTPENVYARRTDKTITIATGEATVWVYDSSYTDAATFKTAMSGVYLVYELASPTTESVDPYQELQVCNRYGTEEYIDRLATAETSPRDVAIPCGHETFYPVNVFDYIDELTKPDNNFIADANIASGKYFSVGNGLYLSTQAIAQGETIIPGTNCTAVSLADALNAINQ